MRASLCCSPVELISPLVFSLDAEEPLASLFKGFSVFVELFLGVDDCEAYRILRFAILDSGQVLNDVYAMQQNKYSTNLNPTASKSDFMWNLRIFVLFDSVWKYLIKTFGNWKIHKWIFQVLRRGTRLWKLSFWSSWPKWTTMEKAIRMLKASTHNTVPTFWDR